MNQLCNFSVIDTHSLKNKKNKTSTALSYKLLDIFSTMYQDRMGFTYSIYRQEDKAERKWPQQKYRLPTPMLIEFDRLNQ